MRFKTPRYYFEQLPANNVLEDRYNLLLDRTKYSDEFDTLSHEEFTRKCAIQLATEAALDMLDLCCSKEQKQLRDELLTKWFEQKGLRCDQFFD
jgi:hypothetical protein